MLKFHKSLLSKSVEEYWSWNKYVNSNCVLSFHWRTITLFSWSSFFTFIVLVCCLWKLPLCLSKACNYPVLLIFSKGYWHVKAKERLLRSSYHHQKSQQHITMVPGIELSVKWVCQMPSTIIASCCTDSQINLSWLWTTIVIIYSVITYIF